MEIGRRRFLFLLGAAAPGLWLAGKGVLALDGQMVLALSGQCSFCGKSRGRVRGLAGRAGGGVRICDECVGLCVDICAEEGLTAPHRHAEVAAPSDGLGDLLAREAHDPRALEAALRSFLDRPRATGRGDDIIRCSFCDVPRRDRRKMIKVIAGPRVFICDACVFDATPLFGSLRRMEPA